MELDSIYEEVINYHINDYIIFEGVLRRDILEVNGILNEEGNKNFIQKMLAGIKKIFGIIVDKLKELLNHFLSAISSIKASVFVKKYEKYYDKENGELDNFKYEKGFYKYKHSGGINIDYFASIDKFKNIRDIEDEMIEIRSNLKDLKSYIQNDLVDNKKLIYPFKEYKQLKKQIMNDIENLSHNREIENIIKSNIKEAEKYEKEIDNKIKNIKEDNSEELNKYKTYLEYLNVYKTYMINSTRIYCSEYLDIFKNYCALYKAGGEYLKRVLKGDKDSNSNSKEYNFEYFYPNKTYDDSIKNKENGVLKALLVGIIGGDPTFITTEFEEALKYIKSKGISKEDLEEKYIKQEDEYDLPKSEWNKQYYGLQLVWLRDNFALKERLPRIKEIGKEVYKNEKTWGKAKFNNRNNKKSSKEESFIDMDYINAIVEAEIYELSL